MRLRFWISTAHQVLKTETPPTLFGSTSKEADASLTDARVLDPIASGSDTPDKEKDSEKDVEPGTWLFKRFRRHDLSLEMPVGAARYQLANEQTYIAWHALADGMSVLGLVVAQISKIRISFDPYRQSSLEDHLLGKPQACICQGIAGLVLIVGTHRFYQQQKAIAHGYIRAAHWEFLAIGALVMLFLLPFLVIVLIANVV